MPRNWTKNDDQEFHLRITWITHKGLAFSHSRIGGKRHRNAPGHCKGYLRSTFLINEGGNPPKASKGHRVLIICRLPGFLAVVWFGSHPLPPPSAVSDAQEDWERKSTLLTEREGRGWARSQILRRRESLVLCKSFNTLRLGISCSSPVNNLPSCVSGKSLIRGFSPKPGFSRDLKVPKWT
jgi:hypothetical protein